MKKIKIVEYNKWHYETLPSWIYLLNVCGVVNRTLLLFNTEDYGKTIIPYFNAYIKEKSTIIFSPDKSFIWKLIRYPFKKFVKYLSFMFKYPDTNDSLFLSSFLTRKNILIFNSIEPEILREKALFFSKKGFKVFMVLHNGDLIHNREYKDLLNLPNVEVFVLSEMVKNYLVNEGLSKTRLMSPVYFKQQKVKTNRQSTIFIVQGNVNFSRRNYNSLIIAIEKLIQNKKFENCKVKILGNSSTNDGKIIKDKVNKKKLDKYFVFYKKSLDFQEFYNEVRESDYLIALQDKTSQQYSPYFRYKCSAVINLSIGFNKILIMHEEQSKMNKFDDMSIVYRDGDLMDAIQTAVNLTNEKRSELESNLKLKRDELLEKSVLSVKDALNL